MDIHPEVNARLREHIIRRLAVTDHGFSALNLHQVSVHCNGAALGHTPDEAEEAHHHEHYGPGGLRNHDYADRSWDPEKIATVLIECAEMDLTCPRSEAAEPTAFPTWRAAVDALMVPATVIARTKPDEHLHLDAADTVNIADWDGTTVCPDGVACEIYPRLYDVKVERTHDGAVRSTHAQRIDNRPDDIARGFLSAQETLVWMEALIHEPTDPLHHMLPTVRKGLDNLRASLAMAYPVLYPEHAARMAANDANGAEDSNRGGAGEGLNA